MIGGAQCVIVPRGNYLCGESEKVAMLGNMGRLDLNAVYTNIMIMVPIMAWVDFPSRTFVEHATI